MTAIESWGYLGVFVAAATPWVEILFVIPAAIALGLHAAPVGAVAFVGNAVPVVGIVAGYEAYTRRRRTRAPRDAGAAANPEQPESKRRRRARRIMRRYGLPVLALAGPLVTGIHLATAIALAVGGRRGAVAGWMTASLALWTVALTVLSALGSDLLRG